MRIIMMSSKPKPPCIIVKWLLDNWEIDGLSPKRNAIVSPLLLLMIGTGMICVFLPYYLNLLFGIRSVNPIVFIAVILIVLVLSLILNIYIIKYIKKLRFFYKLQYHHTNQIHVDIIIRRTIKLLNIQKDEVSISGIGLSILLALSDTTIPIIFNEIFKDTDVLQIVTGKDFLQIMKLSLYAIFFIEIYPIYKFYSILSHELEFILTTSQYKHNRPKESTPCYVGNTTVPTRTEQINNIIIRGDVQRTINLSITPTDHELL